MSFCSFRFIVTALLFFALFALLSCNKNNLDVPEVIVESNETIPLQAAIKNMEETIKGISFLTKSRNEPIYDMSNVIVLGKSSLVNDTKSGVGIDIPDTLLYVVNFKNSEGFAVLAGDERIRSKVFCITEDGSLQKEDFVFALQFLQNETGVDVVSSSEMEDRFVPALILSSALSNLSSAKDDANGGREGGEEGGEIDYDSDYPFMTEIPEQGGVPMPSPLGPYVLTKWNQSPAPFNMYTPNNAYAGCSAIALAQVVPANRYSNTLTFDGVLCDWDEMEGVHNYMNFQSPTYTGSVSGKEQVGHFIASLGRDYLGLDYGTGIGSVSGLVVGNYLKDAMQQLGYYATLRYHPSTFSTTMKQITYDMLKDGLPVLARGTKANSSSGHVWVIDGYKCVISMFNFGHYFHINWGWGGKRDGYYELGTFNTANGISSHPIYDDPSLLHVGNADHYSWNFAIVEYSY